MRKLSMDTIKKFSPDAFEKIAKHVKIYFEGSLDITDYGRFYFEQGRLRIPDEATKEQYGLVTKINQTLKDKVPILKW